MPWYATSRISKGEGQEYDYDENGKISRTTVKGKVSGTDQYSRLQYIYNDQGKVQELTYEIAEGEKNSLRSYKYESAKDGLSTKDTLPDKSTKEYKYDSLRRNTRVIYTPKAEASDKKKLYTSVEYLSGMTSSNNLIGTHNSISSYVNSIGSASNTTENSYEYRYDLRGNICAIDEFNTIPDSKKPHAKNNEDNKRIYQYNPFGEIIIAREIYSDASTKEYAYSYDNGGNIKEEHILRKEGKKTVEEHHTYKYDSNWKDKLISYNDGTGEKTISYDKGGNPNEYLGHKMTWNSVNNSLTSYEDGNRIHLYNYLSGGQRLSKTVGCEMVDGKTVGGKTTTYIYNAGMLLAEDNPDYRINFYYDASGIATEIGYIEKTAVNSEKRHFTSLPETGRAI